MLKKVLVLFAFVFLLMPVLAFGQFATCDPQGLSDRLPPCSSIGSIKTSDEQVGSQSTVGAQTITAVVLQLVNWFSWFVGLAAVVMGLYSGFLFITARDNAQQITAARKTMMWAIIGIGVAIIAFSLVSISKSILNLQ